MIGIMAAILLSLLAALIWPRWPMLVVPVVLVPMSYIALRYEWWGYGVGEFWKELAAVLTLATVAACAVIVLIRRYIQRAVRSGGATPPGAR
ncbi:hypothetical protein [Phytoactinopolyspora limicola]|uniref:hypothetical protein n=1 Tax=Phytoactinopolyspora limicola TaxID=2715536 RepID=UPI00140BD099|nr:hypothetical protein [Phytoactinopolyspora limicola]